ncbi:MAG: hypothetical protein AAF632_05670 [Bacteroidota bacterium]
MKVCIAWIFSLVSLTCFAQTLSTSRTHHAAPPSSESKSSQKEYRYNHVDSIRGSRFLYDDFITGTVHFNDNTKADDLPLRLNIYHDEFQYLKNNSIYALGALNRVDKITMGGEEFIYLDKDSNLGLSGFVKIWNDQFPAVVTKMSMGLSASATIREVTYDYTIPPRFERKDDRHYLMRSESNVVKINSAKHLIYLLCYYSSELEEFIKKEKISSSRGADLAWLIEHYRKVELDP